MGSRYGGLKQIDPVRPNGETIIEYPIYDAVRAEFGKLVFVIRKEIEQPFRETVGARLEKRIPVDYVFQALDNLPPGSRRRPLGQRPSSPRAWFDRPLSDDDFLESVMELTNIEPDGAYVGNTDTAGRVNGLTGSELVSMNMWGFTPQVFQQLREYFHEFLERNRSDLHSESYIPGAVNELVSTGRARVKVLHSKALWFGVTYHEDRPRVVEGINRLVQDGHYYPERLWS
jgi:hypothetical protein